MISTLLNITRPLVVLDTETTGLEPDARIVEVAFQMFYPDAPMKEWRSLVNPEMPIPAAAIRVHGIRDEVVQRCRECEAPRDEHTLKECEVFKPWPTFQQLAANLAKGFTNCDYAGQNVRFDLQRLEFEMRRAGQPWSYVGARILDSTQLERLAVPRSLPHLHEKYVGAKHDGAHGALSDVRAVAAVIAKQLEAYPMLPRDVAKLHEMQFPGYLCDGGQFKIMNGVATCCFGKKWNGYAMKDIDIGFYDWILKSEFPADMKALASNAKMGKFPEAR